MISLFHRIKQKFSALKYIFPFFPPSDFPPPPPTPITSPLLLLEGKWDENHFRWKSWVPNKQERGEVEVASNKSHASLSTGKNGRVTSDTVVQLSVDTFDVSVGQNRVRMREINKLSRNWRCYGYHLNFFLFSSFFHSLLKFLTN